MLLVKPCWLFLNRVNLSSEVTVQKIIHSKAKVFSDILRSGIFLGSSYAYNHLQVRQCAVTANVYISCYSEDQSNKYFVLIPPKAAPCNVLFSF